VDAALAKGDLKFNLHGKKLKGSWVLVRTRGFGSSNPGKSWLLIKHRDQYASTEDITVERPRSAISNTLLAEIAHAGGGDVEKAATGDPIQELSRLAKRLAAKQRATAKQSPARSRQRSKKAS
jgi:hypothetical protein